MVDNFKFAMVWKRSSMEPWSCDICRGRVVLLDSILPMEALECTDLTTGKFEFSMVLHKLHTTDVVHCVLEYIHVD